MSRRNSFEKYCKISTLEVDDEKFCYNTQTMRGDIFRLMDLGADEFRICKKVKSVNPDFCQLKRVAMNKPDSLTQMDRSVSNKSKRGVIYE